MPAMVASSVPRNGASLAVRTAAGARAAHRVVRAYSGSTCASQTIVAWSRRLESHRQPQENAEFQHRHLALATRAKPFPARTQASARIAQLRPCDVDAPKAPAYHVAACSTGDAS